MRRIGRQGWLGGVALLAALGSIATPRIGEATLYGLAGGGGFLVRFDSATPP